MHISFGYLTSSVAKEPSHYRVGGSVFQKPILSNQSTIITDILHLIGIFFGDDAYTFTANGNIEVLAVEAGIKAKMLRFILSSPMK